jgi:type IV secretion system protein TrbL
MRRDGSRQMPLATQTWPTAKRALILSSIFLMMAAVSSAQTPDPPGQILDAYRTQRTTWFTNVMPAANTLFGLLALIDFAWSAAVMVLEKQDFQSWVSALVRKMMTIGAFYALLIYGRFWIPAIVGSFETLGQNAAASGPLDPGAVFMRGLNLSAALMDGASSSGILTNVGGSLAVVFAAAMCLLGFCAITLQFVGAMVESYILVAAGFVFLGFGGSRWSSPYVERYIALAVSIGVKILLLYLLINTGMNVSLSWLDDAERIATLPLPATGAFSIMGSSLIFAALCWHVPKLIVGVIGGSPSFTGNEVLSTVWTVGAGTALIASSAAAGAGWIAAGGRGVMSAVQAVGLGRGGFAAVTGAMSAVNSSAQSRQNSNGSNGGGTGRNQPHPPTPNSNGSQGSATRVVPPKR